MLMEAGVLVAMARETELMHSETGKLPFRLLRPYLKRQDRAARALRYLPANSSLARNAARASAQHGFWAS